MAETKFSSEDRGGGEEDNGKEEEEDNECLANGIEKTMLLLTVESIAIDSSYLRLLLWHFVEHLLFNRNKTERR